MPWDPNASHNDPYIIAQRVEIAYNSHLVLYPAPNDSHSALAALLSSLVDRRYPAAGERPSSILSTPPALGTADIPLATSLPTAWVPGFESPESFIGRVEELARLDRWSTDPEVSLIGITAWGGAGKTALINHWIDNLGGSTRRSSVRGVFGWSFYADPSPEHWADALLAWTAKEFGFVASASLRQATKILTLLRDLPLLLVLDGLEVIQEGLAESGFGRLLDGTLREVLTGLCRGGQPGLTVLTSRFPFADLEAFDGSAARMLDVPPFTLAEGAELMAVRGGGWLEERDRQSLVEVVDGHALAVWVLAGLLGSALPVADLWALRSELAVATRTDARVMRVLQFYADRLTESDRYFVAALSLFNRPVYPSEILTVANHKIFSGRLEAWDSSRIETAVSAQLTGLVTMHPDGTLSAHPLVRDAFRPLAIGAAQVAADVTLTGMPSLALANRATIPRATEAIELLLDASEWSGADSLYRARTGEGVLWRTLPAARLGQRTAMAFASPSRREKCIEFLGDNRLSFYLNEAGLLSALAGDFTTAREYLPVVVELERQSFTTDDMVKALQNLADCLGNLGEVVQARAVAVEALAHASVGSQLECTAHAYLAWTASMAGETAVAERHFSSADALEPGASFVHLYSIRGVRWGEFLMLTKRHDAAWQLTEANRNYCAQHSWNQDVALCDRLLGRLCLQRGDNDMASKHLTSAAACFREGDYLVDLAATLTDLSEHARITGDLESAQDYVTEAISITGPRGLVPIQSVALAIRARIYADLAIRTGDLSYLARGHDAASAALRLATRGHTLPWCELDALSSHWYLDRNNAQARRWEERGVALSARLIPPGLNPNLFADPRDKKMDRGTRDIADTQIFSMEDSRRLRGSKGQ
jgi:tetratricopeptide (TPR) repeat protein